MWEEGEMAETSHLGEEDMRNQVNQADSLIEAVVDIQILNCIS